MELVAVFVCGAAGSAAFAAGIAARTVVSGMLSPGRGFKATFFRKLLLEKPRRDRATAAALSACFSYSERCLICLSSVICHGLKK